MKNAAVRLEGICKRYVPPWQLGGKNRRKRTVQALTDVSLTIPQGEICGLLGVNGAGKTTLIKIIATLILPDAGSGQVGGIDLIRHPLQVRARVGHVTTNERSFYWRLSVYDNLDFFAALHGLHGTGKKSRIADLLNLTAMEEQVHKRFMTLSTGQRQRLAIARALLSDPAVLLLDEPTSGLDPVAARTVKDFIKEKLVREQGKTVLWCTHNLHEAEQVCDRILILHGGRIITDLSNDEIRTQMNGEGIYHLSLRARQSLGQMTAGIVTPLQIQEDGERCTLIFKAKESAVPVIIEQLVVQGAEVFHCERSEVSLEELFSLTVAERQQ